MTKPVLNLLLLFLIIGIASCIDKIDIKTEQPKETLILNSVINPDSNFRVKVSLLASISDTMATTIDNATVAVYQNNYLLELLPCIGNGTYASQSIKPFEGNNFMIKVNYNTDSAWASTEIPVSKTIDSAIIICPVGYDQNLEAISEVKMSFHDDANVENYYELIIKELNSNGTYYNEQFYDIKSQDNTLLDEGDLFYYNNISCLGVFFSDKLFNGQQKTLKYNFVRDFRPPFTNENIYFELRSVSKSYYLFKKYIVRHLYNQNTNSTLDDPLSLLFYGEPTAMYSNIENGYGMFIGFSKKRKLVDIQLQ